MSRVTNLFLVFTFFILLSGDIFAQGAELVVPDSYNSGISLNAAIAADSLRPADRIYVLQRGAFYVVNSPITNTDWTLRIVAEEGSGPRPIIWMDKLTGNQNPNFINHSGSVYLKNIVYVGYIEPDDISDIPGGAIQTNANGFDVVIDGCLMTQQRGQFLRTNSYCRKIVMTNNVFANAGQLPQSNLGAGKIIDLRNVSCDTLIMQNNTIVNFQDRIIRHRSSTAALNYMQFDHNTIINGMSYHGTLALGWVGEKMEITDNLWIDPFSLGNDTDYVRQAEFDECAEFDEYGFAKMTWISSVPNDSTEYVVSGNYYSISDSGQAFFDRHAAAGVTGEGDPLTDHIKSKLGSAAATAFVKESIQLANIPALMNKFNEWYRSPNGGNKTKGTTNFAREFDYDRRPYDYFTDTLDCTYPNTVAAYTGAQRGFPVGDLNWYPELKESWATGGSVGLEDNNNGLLTNYKLAQNYPNPFNPTTKIAYSIPQNSVVSLIVYNALGQEVARLLNNQEIAAGNYDITWNGKDMNGNIVSSGVYFYQLVSKDIVKTMKMMLLK